MVGVAHTEPSRADILKKFVLCAVYILVSASLIRFNKFLMHKDRFPFSMALTAIHMTTSAVLCMVLYWVRPAFFPGIANTEGKRLLLLQWMMPIGLAFAVALYASNQAYLYCSVTFLQFVKEGNVIITFLMSCAVGLQVMNRVRMAVILWVILGSTMAVSGEIHFALIGFVFQLTSQFAECARAVMGEVVLSGGGLKLDPLSYTMFVAPTCLVVLVVGNVFTWDPATMTQLRHWWHFVVPNALLAFTLNVLVAACIKEVSAVGYILTGLVKDIVIVLFSCIAFGEVVTLMQLAGFALTIGGVAFWSYLKIAPDSAAVAFAETLLGVPRRRHHKVPDEHTALMGAANKA